MVARPRLVDRLHRSTELPLTLVVGPAGAGKSTAVIHWLANTTMPVAWLSLEPADGSPNRFLAYMVAALRTVASELEADAAALLAAPESDDFEMLLADAVVIPLAARREPLVLVLDDLHVIDDPTIHSGLQWLLETGPACLRLVVSSRREPPWHLAKLRASGMVGEIGIEDLRFSSSEAHVFYRDVMGLSIDDETIARLEERTEGWPAGAQLSALCLRGARTSEELPSGRDRLIAQYLLSEVFDGLSEPLREFVLATSLLDRFCAPLAAAVTGDERARERLVQLERDSLFTLPLDAHARWFRYHHLFGDFVRERALARESAWVSERHRRAAQWFADRDLRQEAFAHAVSSGDEALITDLFERWAAQTLVWNHTGAIRRWLAAVPKTLRDRGAVFSFMDGWCDVIVGQLETGVSKLDRADEARAAGHASSAILPLLNGMGPVLRVAARLREGRLDEAIRTAQDSCARLDPAADLQQRLTYGSLVMHEGLARLERGELEDATKRLEDAERMLRVHEGANVLTLAHLAEAYRLGGRPVDAERCARRALRSAEQTGTEQLSPAGLARMQLAWLAFERGERELARVELEEGLARLRLLRDVAYLARATELLARVRAAAGEPEDALEAVDEALILMEGTDLRPAVERLTALRHEMSGSASTPSVVGSSPSRDATIEALTPREIEVLRLAATGSSNREIAKRIHVSVGTVKTHMHRVLAKLGVENRTRAVHRARAAGLLGSLVPGEG